MSQILKVYICYLTIANSCFLSILLTILLEMFFWFGGGSYILSSKCNHSKILFLLLKDIHLYHCISCCHLFHVRWQVTSFSEGKHMKCMGLNHFSLPVFFKWQQCCRSHQPSSPPLHESSGFMNSCFSSDHFHMGSLRHRCAANVLSSSPVVAYNIKNIKYIYLMLRLRN